MGCAIGAGTVVLYTFPLFAQGFQREFAWDRSIYANCLSIFLLSTGFGTVTLGIAIRRFGVRSVACAYVLLFAASTSIAGLLPASPAAFYSVFVLIGLGGAAATALPYAVAVTGLFDERRGFALGLVNAGAGFGSTLAPQAARVLLEHLGWRGGFVSIGALAGVVPILGLVFLVTEPRRSHAGVYVPASQSLFLKSREFWYICAPILGVSIATFGVMGSIVPFLTDRALALSSVTLILSTAGMSSWAGRLATGYLLDRVFAPVLAATSFVIAIIGIGLLACSTMMPLELAGAALVGVTLGAEGDLVAYLVSRYFDFTHFSRVLGVMWIAWAWGGGMGTFATGMSFRLTHSYLPSWAGFAFMLLVSAVVVTRLSTYRHSTPAPDGPLVKSPV